MSLIEIIIFITGIIYVVLAARNNPVCWFWGIVSCALLAYVSFTSYKLYADGFLQVVYVVMGFVGIYQWTRDHGESAFHVRRLKYSHHLTLIVMGSLIALITGYLLQRFSGAFGTYIDSFTTVFGLIATGLLIQKYIGNWVYWIIIDVVMAVLYLVRGFDLEEHSGYATAALMMVYAIVSVYGLYQWRVLLRRQQPNDAYRIL